MRLVTFDALRTLGIEGVSYIKPELMYRHVDELIQADWLLFPEYWQINSLAYGLGKKVFPSIASYHLGHNKIEMTRCFQMIAPGHVPDTLILPNTPSAQRQVLEQFDFPFVGKIVKSARGEGVFRIDNHQQFYEYLSKVDVVYVQELLPIDRDLRVLVIGEQVVGGYWRVGQQDGFHNNVAQGGEIVAGLLPEAAVRLVEQVIGRAGINYAGFDIAMVGTHPYILEFNRLFGTQGVAEIGLNIPALVADYLNCRRSSCIDTNLSA